ncbi:hypothetical protein SDC9_92831 [bioreactor metagenome]|uniref:Uncharacterized protein n=1 Tax=bioreactor metagenome TaxID=1076179 RepID=A0A645A5K0_9ZZZZ
MKKLLIVTALLSTLICKSQNNIYEWGEGMTFYKGWIDTTRISLNQIDSIHQYLFDWPMDILEATSIWKIEQMDSVSTSKLDAFFVDRMSLYYSMTVPESAFWDSLVDFRIQELRSMYLAYSEFLKGFNDPEFLLDPSHPECEKYALPLNGNEESLLSAWRSLIDQMKENNGYPGLLESKYQEQLSSPDMLKYARLDLMRYGWWNCRNQYVYYHEDDNRIEEEFEKLFIKVERFDEE